MGRGQEEEDTGKGEEDFVSKPVLLEEMYVCRVQTQPKPPGDQAVSHRSEKHRGEKAQGQLSWTTLVYETFYLQKA